MAMPHTTLVDGPTLASHLGDPAWAIVDCRFNLAEPGWGEHEYESAHIPGAVYAHLDRDLSGPKTGANGRHPLPDPGTLAARLGALGIDRDVQVVAYDQNTGIYASRLWWMLRWLGHNAAAVLDGGYAGWLGEGRPTTAGRDERRPRTFVATAQPALAVDLDETARLAGQPGWTLLDARSPERFRGENETIDNAAGHIPGAADHFYMRNLGSDGKFLEPARLRAEFEGTTAGTPPGQIVCYCGSGVTACHNILALEHAGLHGAKLYAGSWSEWSSDPERQVATGD